MATRTSHCQGRGAGRSKPHSSFSNVWEASHVGTGLDAHPREEESKAYRSPQVLPTAIVREGIITYTDYADSK